MALRPRPSRGFHSDCTRCSALSNLNLGSGSRLRCSDMSVFIEREARAGFAFFGFVPTRISYDNTKVAVSQILGAHERKLTAAFGRLVSHYLFKAHFCRVRRANEKGVVEGAVKYSRLNFLVPVPDVAD